MNCFAETSPLDQVTRQTTPDAEAKDGGIMEEGSWISPFGMETPFFSASAYECRLPSRAEAYKMATNRAAGEKPPVVAASGRWKRV